MQASNIPANFSIPFANSAGAGYIRPVPVASQIGVHDGWASLTDGFPPVTFLPIAGGGVPPFGQDFNGILNRITATLQAFQAGYFPLYNSTFSTSIGGYPLGAVLRSTDTFSLWISTVDNNTSNPDTGGANWSLRTLGVQAGTIEMYGGPNVPAGYLECDGTLLLRADYPRLFFEIGLFWDTGADSTHFRLPDMRGLTPRGWDHGRGIDNPRALGSFQDYATAAPKTTTAQRLTASGVTALPGGTSNPSNIGFMRASKSGESVTIISGDATNAGTEPDLFSAVTGDAETRSANNAVMFIIKT